MALSETAKLFVNLSLTGNFASQMQKANKSLSTFEASSNRAYRAGQQIGTGLKNVGKIAAVGVGLLTTQVAFGLQSLIKLEKATAQTEAVIKSTGGAAGITAAQVQKLSEKYESLNATVSDEVITAGQNLLLTYTNVRKDAFEPALEAALNLSTALGTDLDSAIKTVGKALSDPAKAMARLTRQGIILTKQEQKQIETHLENNDTLAAQNVILGALDKRYGDSFLAGGNTTAGKVAKFGDAIEDLQRSLAVALLPAVSNVADAMTELLADPEIIQGAKDLGEEIGKLFSKENIKTGARALGAAFDTIKSAMPAIKAGLSGVASVVGTAVKAFMSLPPEIQKLAIAALAVNKLTGGLVTNIAGGLISSVLKQLVSGVVNVQGGVVNVVGAGGVPGAATSAAGGAMGLLKNVLKVAVVGAVVVEGFNLWAQSVGKFVEENQQFKDQGLNAAEVAALRYYNASAADQATMAKHIGRIPTIADWQSALAKLNKPMPGTNASGGKSSQDNDPDKRQWRNDNAERLKALAIETRKGQAAVALEVQRKGEQTVGSVDTAKDRITASQAETKRETTRGAQSVSAATRQGTSTVAGATRGVSPPIVAAIRANRPIINVSVSSTSITKVTTDTARYGKNSGSGGQNQVKPA
jgi:hypothetical protein